MQKLLRECFIRIRCQLVEEKLIEKEAIFLVAKRFLIIILIHKNTPINLLRFNKIG
ncbi:hypothetical protein [Shouchella lehensis]|uniref:hypothetical protein n=1 Tax=Shouchella lehensis TaxID=300825 RepID=UPI00130ED1D4